MQNFEVTGFCWRVIEAYGDSAWYPLPPHKVRKVFEIDTFKSGLAFRLWIEAVRLWVLLGVGMSRAAVRAGTRLLRFQIRFRATRGTG